MHKMPLKLIVVDDDENILQSLKMALESNKSFRGDYFNHPHEALKALMTGPYALALIDLRMRPLDGIGLLKKIRKVSPETLVILMTARGSVSTAVEAMKAGAHDYIEKPFDFEHLNLLLERAATYFRAVGTLNRYGLPEETAADTIDTRHTAMLELLKLATRVAASPLPVLIEGESGTGKELLARHIVRNSPRHDKPFIAVNCAAIPESLMESELFGHTKGAFTGAVSDRRGLFAEADGGTLFLDEIGEMPVKLQARLLRVLQEGEIHPLGSARPRKVDVRIIAATNVDIEQALAEKLFREDLFYRLNGLRLSLPPLRERPEDIPLLTERFLRDAGREDFPVSTEAMHLLLHHHWPGNVRELENTIRRALLLAGDGRIEAAHLPPPMARAEQPGGEAALLSLEAVEKEHIRRVLSMAEDYTQAARILGINSATLWRKRQRYKL